MSCTRTSGPHCEDPACLNCPARGMRRQASERWLRIGNGLEVEDLDWEVRILNHKRMAQKLVASLEGLDRLNQLPTFAETMMLFWADVVKKTEGKR